MAAADLTGLVAVITGAGAGIGRCIALQFAAHRCRLFLTDINVDGLKETAQLCQTQGSSSQDIVTHIYDLSEESNIQQLAERALNVFHDVNILVNNAGASHPGDSATHRVTAEALDFQYKLLLKAPILLTKYLIPTLKKNNGCVINIASIAGVIASPGITAYTVTKAGVVSFTRAAAKELAPHVRVNSISPGPVETNMTAYRLMTSIERYKNMTDKNLANIALKRFGKPEEIARAAVYLARETFITGTNLIIDGGVSLPLYNETVLPKNASKV